MISLYDDRQAKHATAVCGQNADFCKYWMVVHVVATVRYRLSMVRPAVAGVLIS
jgi:hypothetical protein